MLLLDRCTATLATPINNLFVRKHSLVFRTPFDRGFAVLGEPVLEDFCEKPLCPLVVTRIAGHHLFTPIKRSPHRGELFAHPRHICIRPFLRVSAILNGRVFGGQTECIEANRKEHVFATRAQHARVDVSNCKGVPVADMQVTRGIGELRQKIIFLFRRFREVSRIQIKTCPFLLGFFFDVCMVVRHVLQSPDPTLTVVS